MSEETVTLSSLDELLLVIKRSLRMDMKDKIATSRVHIFFISYITVLRNHGPSWILKDSQKIVVNHGLSQIKPHSFQSLLNEDLNFSDHDFPEKFQCIFKHSVKLAGAFQIVMMDEPAGWKAGKRGSE